MEKGNLRCDANVSVRAARRTAPLGTRVEIKNLNSIRFVAKAHRARDRRGRRRRSRAASGSSRRRASGTSRPGARSRCAARKRRTTTGTSRSRTWARSSSTRPGSRRRRARCPSCRARGARASSRSTGSRRADAETLVSARELADYFEDARASASLRKLAANWVTGEVLRWMKERKISPEDALVVPGLAGAPGGAPRARRVGRDLGGLGQGGLRGDAGLARARPRRSSREKGLGQMRDAGALEAVVAEVVAREPLAGRALPLRARPRPSAGSSGRS